MGKKRGIIIMGVILSLFATFGFTGCGKNNFNPAPDAQIVEMSISYSGMTRDSHYFFSLRAEGSAVIFNCEFFSFNEEGEILAHTYEDVSVDPSYMNELRKLAEQNDLITSMKHYHEPKKKPELLDGDVKSTTIIMSDKTNKNAGTIFGSEYHSFFVSIVEAYSEFDSCDNFAKSSE